MVLDDTWIVADCPWLAQGNASVTDLRHDEDGVRNNSSSMFQDRQS